MGVRFSLVRDGLSLGEFGWRFLRWCGDSVISKDNTPCILIALK